ncbi:MAG: YtxH domain-containing protein [Candidatus Gottesmanbacteria bacterium]|nr:YtxH domain-containing protein [Candidatus Gottesmanbacteria bacterium]
MSDNNQSHGTDIKFLAGFFIGGLIGALTIFFLGTKEGKKAGKLLQQKGEDVLGELEDQVEELEQKGKDLLKHGEEIKEQVLEKIEDKSEEFTETASRKLDSALAHIEEIQEHGRETTASIRKRLFKNLPKKS